MSISDPYVKNAQVIVVKADSAVTATADLEGQVVVAEMGSAGEAQVIGEEPNADLAKAEYVGVAKQTDCLMEVKAGTADAAVLDWTLAKSMVGEGTDFADLKMIEGVELATEEYGIAFRQGSDFTAKVDEAIKALVADGTLPALAEKYGLALAPAIAG
jgi:polar amino acid transport system substrate-binding protein